MFSTTRYISNSLTITFPRQFNIRRKANDLEDELKGLYLVPQIVGIPDDLDPSMPRIIFGSEHGFSQIVISQVSIVLNVQYSPEWQEDIAKGHKYLQDRTQILFRLLGIIDKCATVRFCGFGTLVRLPSEKDNSSIVSRIAEKCLVEKNTNNINELSIKTTKIISNKYFSNITYGNYNAWNVQEDNSFIPRLLEANVLEKGVEITGDLNDRYAYNEVNNYKTDCDGVTNIIDLGFSEINKVILFLKD